MSLYDIARLGDDIFRARNFNIYSNLCGHFIGQKLHEEPSILHTLLGTPKSIIPLLKDHKLSVGDTLCIEPAITLSKNTDNKIDQDGWSMSSKDGSMSAHFEHTLLIVENGIEIIS
jgi:methionyl aminopeptidase